MHRPESGFWQEYGLWLLALATALAIIIAVVVVGEPKL